ncbi:MAG: hypothetical protein P9L99_16500 [Candidatus Lernaella stagnicola]|nr:hypothetical protein [Candidatus Lernaella stagnicola]
MSFALAVVWLIAIFWLLYRPKIVSGAKREWILLGLLMATGLAAYLSYLLPLAGRELAFPIDDSYITLSAARNLAERNLFAVNPDAPLAGITSPLHVLLVGLLGKLIGVIWADRLLGLLAFFAVIAGTYRWIRKLDGSVPAALLGGAAITLGGPMAFGALNGLETNLFAALVVWTLILVEGSEVSPRRTVGIGALLGLSVLTRPEGYFLVAAILGVLAVRALLLRDWRRLAWVVAAGVVAAVVISPYWLANYKLVGHIMPVTVSAKKHFFAAACMPPLARLGLVATSPILLLGVFLLFLPLFLWAGAWWRRVSPALFIGLFYAAYLVEFPGALTHYWGRYQHPLLPVVFGGMALGADRLLNRWHDAESNRPRKIVLVLLIPFLLIVGLGGSLQRGVYRNAIATASEGGYLMNVVQWLQENTKPDEVVAAHDIGLVTFFSGRKVLDLVGLSDPEVAAVYADTPPPCRGHGERAQALYSLLRKRRPAVIYFHPEWNEKYMRIIKTDNGRFLSRAHTMQKTMGKADRSFIVHTYHFYRANWDGAQTNQVDQDLP